MTLPPVFRKALVQCILNNFGEADFQNLTNNYINGYNFQQVRPGAFSYVDSIGPYIDQTARIGKIGSLVDAINKEREQDGEVKSMYEQFQNIFSSQGSTTKFKGDIFRKEVLKKQQALFIARDFFGVSLARMVNEEKIGMLGLRGQPKTGLSYVSSYLGDIQDELNCFKFLKLNLSDIGESYPEEIITAAHLAEIISNRLQMKEFPGIKDFKLAPFISKLTSRLDELAKNEEKWLFFFDQFDYPCNKDVKILLKNFGKIINDHPNAFYLVFSTYENWAEDWGPDLSDLVQLLDFRPFTEAEVNQYLDRLYNTKEINFRAIHIDTFMAGTKISLSKEIYNTSTGSNVPLISKELKVWFREIKNMLPK